MYYHKNYQRNDVPLGTLVTKVKGLGFLSTDINASIIDSIPDYLKHDFESNSISSRIMLDTAGEFKLYKIISFLSLSST